MRVRRLGYALGAEVTGIRLAGPMDDAEIAEIRGTWLEHALLCFPGQKLDSDGLLTFARRFGELETIRKDELVRRDAGRLEDSHIDLLTNKPIDGRPWDGFKNGRYWHTDKSFTVNPTSGTFISCQEIPQAGGDTMFANMYLAYESLSPAMRAIVEPLSAIHEVPQRRSAGNFATAQPVVRIHPETNRRGLYLGDRIRRFVGMTEEESKPLIDFLNRHAVSYEFTYRHRWTAEDLVMWDNRCLMHIALCDYDLENDPRHMLRCAIVGERSGRHYDESDAGAAAAAVAAVS